MQQGQRYGRQTVGHYRNSSNRQQNCTFAVQHGQGYRRQITLGNKILAHESFIVFVTKLFTLNSNMQSYFLHHSQFLYNDFFIIDFSYFRYFFSDIIIREPIFYMVLNRGWSQTIYHYQITSCMFSETGS